MREYFSPSAHTESSERVELWRTLKREASQKADACIAAIDGFYGMSKTEKITAIEARMDELSHDNANRYIVRALSFKVAALQAELQSEALRAQGVYGITA